MGLGRKRRGGVFEGGLIPQCTLCYGRKKNIVDKDNSTGFDDGFQTNQNWIWKKNNKVEEVDYESIVILTENQGLKTKLKGNKTL